MVLLSGVSKTIENNAGLHAGNAARWIDHQNFRHIFGEIQHHGHIAALPSERGSSASAENWSIELARDCNRRNDVVGCAWQNHSDWNLTIVRSVGGVKRAAASVEAYFAAKVSPQCRFEPNRIHATGFSYLGEFGEICQRFYRGAGQKQIPRFTRNDNSKCGSSLSGGSSNPRD